jgi:hypothetical protein
MAPSHTQCSAFVCCEENKYIKTLPSRLLDMCCNIMHDLEYRADLPRFGPYFAIKRMCFESTQVSNHGRSAL